MLFTFALLFSLESLVFKISRRWRIRHLLYCIEYGFCDTTTFLIICTVGRLWHLWKCCAFHRLGFATCLVVPPIVLARHSRALSTSSLHISYCTYPIMPIVLNGIVHYRSHTDVRPTLSKTPRAYSQPHTPITAEIPGCRGKSRPVKLTVQLQPSEMAARYKATPAAV